MLSCGDTFLAGNDDHDEDFHLRIIITPPNEGEVVVVCVVSAHKRSEQLVVLNDDKDHSFIKHKSVIAYRWSEIRAVADIETAIQNGTAKKREPIRTDILKKAQDCLLESIFTPNGVRQYFKQVMGR